MGNCLCRRSHTLSTNRRLGDLWMFWGHGNFDESVFSKVNYSKPWGVNVLASGPPRRPCAFVVLSFMRRVFIESSRAQFWDPYHRFAWLGACFAMLCGATWKNYVFCVFPKKKTILRAPMFLAGKESLWIVAAVMSDGVMFSAVMWSGFGYCDVGRRDVCCCALGCCDVRGGE